MRLLHLSDLHLGFRQFQRTTPTGINQREADVAASFTRAIDRVIELRPDILLIAGDVFHSVRPTNPAILHAFMQFSRLMRELPNAIVVMIAGNHDVPRSSETLCILRLFSPLGIHVVDTAPRRLTFAEHGLSIFAVPYLPSGTPALDPDPTVGHNVLLIHGAVEGAVPALGGHGDREEVQIPVAEVANPAWDYVALGHIHVYTKVAPKAFYSGAIDYTSSTVWLDIERQKAEKLPGKGMIERDLETGKQVFHPLPVAREFLDLPAISARGLSAADLDAAIAKAIERAPGGIDDKVVRLVARDVPRHIARELDHKTLREYQRRALHFHLDTRRPEVRPSTIASGAPGRRPSLADILRDSLRNRVLSSDIARDRLVELGAHYLREAEAAGTARDLSTAVDES